MIVGGEGGYVGLQLVGATDAAWFSYVGVGSVAFSGTVHREVTKDTSGGLSFFGDVSQDVTKLTSGGITYTGGFSGKQYTRTQRGTVEFVGTAPFKITTTHRSVGSTGGISLEGSASFARAYIAQADLGYKSGVLSWVGLGYVGEESEAPAGVITFLGTASKSKKETKFSIGDVSFEGDCAAYKHKEYTAINPGINLFGILGLAYNQRATIWYGSLSTVAQSSSEDSSVWDNEVPVEPEDDFVPVSAWETGTVAGGVVVSGGRVW
jgi:hypothetical protein